MANNIYSIPRVFVSGANASNAISRWRNVPQRVLQNCQNLNNAVALQGVLLLNAAQKPIKQFVKGIEDYGFSCASHGQYQHFAHSERSAILSILCDREYSIAEAIRKFNARFPRVWISQLVIQIKIAYQGGVCGYCESFFNHNSGISTTYIHPVNWDTRIRSDNPNNQGLGVFGSLRNVGYRIYEVRRDIANVLRVTQGHGSVPISLRISHITTHPILWMIPAAPLASSV